MQRIVQLSLSGSGINKSTLERIVYFISFWGYKTHCSVHTNIYFQILTHILQKIIITVWWYCTFYLISHNERNIIRKESILSHWSQPVQIRIKHSRFHQKTICDFYRYCIFFFYLNQLDWDPVITQNTTDIVFEVEGCNLWKKTSSVSCHWKGA